MSASDVGKRCQRAKRVVKIVALLEFDVVICVVIC